MTPEERTRFALQAQAGAEVLGLATHLASLAARAMTAVDEETPASLAEALTTPAVTLMSIMRTELDVLNSPLLDHLDEDGARIIRARVEGTRAAVKPVEEFIDSIAGPSAPYATSFVTYPEGDEQVRVTTYSDGTEQEIRTPLPKG